MTTGLASDAVPNGDDGKPDDPNAVPMRPNNGLTAFFRMTGGFWTKASRQLSWSRTLAVLAAMLLQIASQVAINAWHRYFFVALERKSAADETALLVLASAAPCNCLTRGIGGSSTRRTACRFDI